MDDSPEVTATGDSSAPADSAQADGAGDIELPGAAEEFSPASTVKRPMVNAAEDEGPVQDPEDLPPRKRARKSSSSSNFKGETPGSVEEGEVSSGGSKRKSISNSSGGPDSSSPDESSQPPPPTSAATGLRTSFGPRAQGSKQSGNPDMLVYNPLTLQERTGLVLAIQDAESKGVVPLIKKRELSWTVNPVESGFEGTSWLEVFNSILDRWCEAFLAANQENIAKVGLAPAFLKQAFLRRLDDELTPRLPPFFITVAEKQLKNPEASRLRDFAGDFKPDLKKIAKRLENRQAKQASENQQQQQEQQQEEEQAISAIPTPTTSSSKPAFSPNLPQPIDTRAVDGIEARDEATAQQLKRTAKVEPGQASDAGMDLDVDQPIASVPQAELDQRHRYYPGVPDGAIFCLTCARYGHATATCPEMTCKFCHGQHFKYECPARQRCTKCKQLGHAKASCAEKLAVAPGEAVMECAVCEGHDHTEQNCSRLWQIYCPQPNSIKKVRSLPMFCYCCGASGHYGGDCGIADRSVPPTKTWTFATAAIYIDPASTEPALSDKNTLPPSTIVSKPIIPGRSIKPQSHVVYEESDEEDSTGAFVRGTVSLPGTQSTGKIQIASNITFGGASATTAAGPSNLNQQQNQQQNSNSRHPRRNRNPVPEDPPHPPPTRQGSKNYPLRSGKKVSRARQGQGRQQPPLPPGTPPRSQASGGQQQQQPGGHGGGGRGGGSRGRGGFSGLGKRNRARGRFG